MTVPGAKPGSKLAAVAFLLSFGTAAVAQTSPAAPVVAAGSIEPMPAPATGAKFQPSLIYFADTFAVLDGGLKRQATYVGRLGIIVDSDLDALLGWKGATAHLSIHQIHGVGITPDYAGALMAVSSIEAEPATRLFNIWIEQALGSKASARIGQFTAGQEFFLSTVAAPFVNATFGWPAVMAQNLPSGGAAYPLATPGVRVRVAPSPRTTVLLAIFNGDPAGPGDGDPQRRDSAGFNAFRLSGAPFLIGEIQHSGTGGACAICGPTIRIGAWAQSGKTANQYGDASGAAAAADGHPAPSVVRRGNYGAYAILDYGIYQDGPRQVAVFVRIGATPPDRNLVDVYADAGITGTGLIPGRPGDLVGFAIGYSHLSVAARRGDSSATVAASTATGGSQEIIVEATYRFHVTSHVSVQPDVQFIVNPSLQLTLPAGDRPLTPVRNALVAGVRLNLRF